MITSNIYRIHSHCCRVLSLRVLHFDFMLEDMIAVLEKFLARHRRSTVLFYMYEPGKQPPFYICFSYM